MFFPKTEKQPKPRFIGLFESEEALNTCVTCMGYENHIMKEASSGNGRRHYKLYVPEKKV
jgi:hypothetical protein